MGPSVLSLAAIALLGLINLARGSIHLLAPDGGLEMIAGLDTSAAPALALSLIGAVGAGQISFAFVDLAAVTLHRPFVRPLLLVHTLQQALAAFLLFAWRPMPHDVPGQWGALAALVVVGFFAALEYSRTSDASA
jgi:hypothetical protein